MHEAAYRWVQDTLRVMPKPTRVLEIGSRNINGSVRPLFGAVEYVGVDLVAGPDVDVVADGVTYQPEALADVVVCCEVLEHLERAPDLVRNLVACAAPGGHVLITCATTGRLPHSAVDGGPLRNGEFYQNVPVGVLSGWLQQAGAEVERLKVDASAGDVYVLARKPV